MNTAWGHLGSSWGETRTRQYQPVTDLQGRIIQPTPVNVKRFRILCDKRKKEADEAARLVARQPWSIKRRKAAMAALELASKTCRVADSLQKARNMRKRLEQQQAAADAAQEQQLSAERAAMMPEAPPPTGLAPVEFGRPFPWLLVILGALGLGGFLFRKQLMGLFRRAA